MIRWVRCLGDAPAVLHVGLGAHRWWIGGRDVVSDGTRLWWVRGAHVACLPIGDVTHVLGDASHLRVRDAAGRRFRVDPAGHRRVRERGRCWEADGFLYQHIQSHTPGVPPTPETRVVDRTGSDRRWTVGPRGAVLGGPAEMVTHGGAPGRTPRPLPTPLWRASVRFRRDGRAVAGVTPDGDRVWIDLRTATILDTGDGTPVSYERWLTPDGTLHHGDRVVRRGLAEHSCAVADDRLAGPGGLVWDLTTGRPRTRAPALALGLTVAHPHGGFVTLDWGTDRGWTVDHAGQIRDPFALDLAPGDTIAAGAPDGDGVRLQTALGHQVTVVAGIITPTTGPPLSSPSVPPVVGPAGPMEVDGTTMVNGQHFAWTEDGWLWAWPQSYGAGSSASEAS